MDAPEAERWLHNRHRLYERVDGCDFIVLAANRRQQRANDTAYPFRQDSTFYYYTGLDEPELLMVADLKGEQEWLIAPDRGESEVIFDGKASSGLLEKRSGLIVMSESEGWHRFKQLMSDRAVIGIVDRLSATPRSMTRNGAHIYLHRRLRSLKSRPRLNDISAIVAQQRAIKQPWEVQNLQQAIDLTGQAFKRLQRGFPDYAYEYEIAADAMAVFHRKGAEVAYEPIIAGGANALTLHYVKNQDALKSGSLLLMDIGAEVDNYCADITRTYPVSGTFSARQKEIYEAVLDLQRYAISLLKPGMHFPEYGKKTDARLKEVLAGLDLPADKSQQYMPHSIGHGLGLDVHDSLAFKSLQPGMVITVEPGIYIRDEATGVRIEDDILITESGNQVLSRAIEREPERLEGLLST